MRQSRVSLASPRVERLILCRNTYSLHRYMPSDRPQCGANSRWRLVGQRPPSGMFRDARVASRKRSSLCRLTKRVKVGQDRKSTSLCAPRFTDTYGQLREKCRKTAKATVRQINIILHRFKPRSSSWFPEQWAHFH